MTTSDQLELAVVAKGQMSLTATALLESCGELFHDVFPFCTHLIMYKTIGLNNVFR